MLKARGKLGLGQTRLLIVGKTFPFSFPLDFRVAVSLLKFFFHLISNPKRQGVIVT
jgi:hypothetical protein